MAKTLAGTVKIVDNVHIVLIGPDGKVKDERRLRNTVTTAGKAGASDQLLAAPSLTKAAWIAIGTGSPAATLLGAEVARVAMSPATGRAGSVVTYQASFPAGTGTGAITEAGTFDVVTANTVNMWMSASFSVINKLAGDSLAITWTLTYA